MLLQLPPELILLIATNLEADTDISSFARTSRVLYHQLVDFLYKNSQENSERQPLLWACSEGKERTVELAMRNLNNDIANIHVYGEALTRASASGHLKIVETVLQKVKTLLIERDHYDCDYWVDAALLEAARHGHQVVVQLLVEEGAGIEEYDPEGPPLILAAAGGHADVVEYLLKNGACVHRTNRIGWTALHEAARIGDAKTVEALVKRGAKVDQVGERDEDGNTALLLAAMEGHEDVVKYLLNEGANAHHRNTLDETALRLEALEEEDRTGEG